MQAIRLGVIGFLNLSNKLIPYSGQMMFRKTLKHGVG
jgi:hypothetical protein